jgi:cyclomaltodextrinase / maltogenic alpha-amylase / neopullulanase
MLRFSFFIVIFLCFAACKQKVKPTEKALDSLAKWQPKSYIEVKHPEWSKNATIYEANIRQYTPEGNFKAFEAHLPRLKEMGVDIIWLMPIHPIGEKNRKGGKGSYYSVKDYFGVNPEFGTMDELKHLVNTIHEMGMYVIIDWVANHSAWDNPLVEQHPDWYTRSREGNFQPTQWYDWDDIIDFDYNKPEMRAYMAEAMKFWVKEANIDGYRCDTGGFIPIDFWEEVRAELDQIKPVFMLAEWESRDMHRRAFDASYAWSLWDHMHAATSGKKGPGAVIGYLAHDVNTFPEGAYRMTFTDNHDKNSWEGNMYSNFGDGLEASMILCGVVNGMPLVYSGQEAGLNRSLKFFDKDLIEWKNHPNAELYKKIFALKHQNQALWNGTNGGVMDRVTSDKMDQVISFIREKNGNMVLPIINYTSKPAKVKLNTSYLKGSYTEWFSGKEIVLSGDDTFELKPWQYLILTRQK